MYPCLADTADPMFDVMIRIVFLKSTTRPCRRQAPSSHDAEDVEYIGCAFSISSNSTTAYAGGESLRSLPAFVVPTYPEARDQPRHECFSMYSDMSMRTIACSSRTRTRPALAPTRSCPPVGPKKMNEPIGLRGSLNPAREPVSHWRHVATRRPANHALRKRSSMVTSFFTSPSSIFDTGMPVHLLTIWRRLPRRPLLHMRDCLPSMAALSFPTSAQAAAARILESAPRDCSHPCVSLPALPASAAHALLRSRTLA